MYLLSSLAALLPLSICLLAPAARADDEETVSVFLPYYSEKWWSDMHGSIISKDDEKTEYTIFCPTQTPQRCNLAGDTPFTFTEGPETLIFHDTVTSTYIMNLECDLEGQTAATCSGYSSLKSGYVAGTNTGPTEITWKSTFVGPEVVWAPITLTDEVPSGTEGVLLDITATAMEPPEETGEAEEPPHSYPSGDTIFPQETGLNDSAARSCWAGGWAGIAVGAAAAFVVAAL